MEDLRTTFPLLSSSFLSFHLLPRSFPDWFLRLSLSSIQYEWVPHHHHHHHSISGTGWDRRGGGACPTMKSWGYIWSTQQVWECTPSCACTRLHVCVFSWTDEVIGFYLEHCVCWCVLVCDGVWWEGVHVLPTSLFHSAVCDALLLFPLFVSGTLYPFQLCYWLQGFDSSSFCLSLFVPHFSGSLAFFFQWGEEGDTWKRGERRQTGKRREKGMLPRSHWAGRSRTSPDSSDQASEQKEARKRRGGFKDK